MFQAYYHPDQKAFHIDIKGNWTPMGEGWELLYEHESRNELEDLIDMLQKSRNNKFKEFGRSKITTLNKDLQRLEKLINEITETHKDLCILCFAKNPSKTDHLARNLDVQTAIHISEHFIKTMENPRNCFFLNTKHGFDL